jgi:hypothetical protein
MYFSFKFCRFVAFIVIVLFCAATAVRSVLKPHMRHCGVEMCRGPLSPYASLDIGRLLVFTISLLLWTWLYTFQLLLDKACAMLHCRIEVASLVTVLAS